MATADMDLGDLIEVKIQVASGQDQSLSLAPAVASVITGELIHAMGATSLDELLETVAGLHVTPSKVGILSPRYSIRGIESNTAGGMLVLLNGVPITRAAEGTPILGFQLPVTGIERVEIIRGPGSAIYGADAIGGVIDIITKTAADIAGTRVGLRAGSFDSRDAWLQHGSHAGQWDVALTLDLRKTDGDDGRLIERDRQSDLDELFGTSASLAPGPISSRSEIANVHLQLERSGWTARVWGFRNERGVGVGIAQALDPQGSQESELLMSDLSYAAAGADGDWEFTQTLSHINSRTDTDFNFFPPGALLPIGADGNVDFADPAAPLIAFPDGLIARPGVKQRTLGFNSVAFFSGFERHSLRFNIGLERDEFEATDRRNFGPGVLDGTEGVVGGTLTHLTGTDFAFSPDVDRHHWYLSFQDQWRVSDKVELTLGSRYDQFSDFGGTFNPRLALVWIGHPNLTTKLLYGRAFRAPSFAQLFTSNNPSFLGNPELKPEFSQTLELVLDGRPRPRLRTVLSAYYYQIKDMIGLLPDPGLPSFTAQNAARQDGYGFEFELAWEASDAMRLQSNYAFQEIETSGTPKGRHEHEAPEHQFYLGAHWRFKPRWSGFLRINRVGARHRMLGDSRPRLGSYTTVDLTLRRERLWGELDLVLLGRNLFDEAGREPADPVLPNDYPIPGRMLAVEISYRLH